ncbi:GDP-mannose 4,6-dehydratase [Roseibium algae]|uniref:GDP-mannose 4,6-dehydratase n=1 Tax=Roseibium algae TaxID=3123038 RepID=A0ABU8TS34_9HYPH
MTKVVITGGAGFIGSHIVDRFVMDADTEVTIFDKMTYAADYRNIASHIENNRVALIVGDICDEVAVWKALEGADIVIHAAAESHVDHSFNNSALFTKTNVLGTHTLLEAARQLNVRRFVQISTDEVYGEVLSGEADEDYPLSPTNPYSASKAAAEMIACGYITSFRMPIVMIRANNVYGIRQFPEKLIPRSIIEIIKGGYIPVHGSGRNRRHYLLAQEAAEAIYFIAYHGVTFETYNIGSVEEFENIDVIGKICRVMDINVDDVVKFVEDRPFNDRRYAINAQKLEKLGFQPSVTFDVELPKIIDWYRLNSERYFN